MKLPIQAPPVIRQYNTMAKASGIIPQDCFPDCLIDRLGLPDIARKCNNIRDISSLAECIVSAGAFIGSPTSLAVKFAAYTGYCGLKCIF